MMRILKADRACLTTTLYRLRKYGACNKPDGDEPGRYDHLVSKLGPGYGDRKPINLLSILAHNGVEDMLWALCATSQNCDRVARLLAAAFAEEVLPIFECARPNDKRPRETIRVVRRYARGKATVRELESARAAAWAAAVEAGSAVVQAGSAAVQAGSAAVEAGSAAVQAAAGAFGIAWYAGLAAGDAGGAGEQQANIIRRYLLPDKAAKGAA